MKLGDELRQRIEVQGLGRVAVAAGMSGLLLVIALDRNLDATANEVDRLTKAVELLEAEAN